MFDRMNCIYNQNNKAQLLLRALLLEIYLFIDRLDRTYDDQTLLTTLCNGTRWGVEQRK